MTKRLLLLGIPLAALVLPPVVTYAVESHHINQKGRAFSAREITISTGDSILFDNSDEFIHQVYVKSSSFNFDTAESSPGDTIEIKFTVAGTFEVHCHIHPKMGLVVKVQ